MSDLSGGSRGCAVSSAKLLTQTSEQQQRLPTVKWYKICGVCSSTKLMNHLTSRYRTTHASS